MTPTGECPLLLEQVITNFAGIMNFGLFDLGQADKTKTVGKLKTIVYMAVFEKVATVRSLQKVRTRHVIWKQVSVAVSYHQLEMKDLRYSISSLEGSGAVSGHSCCCHRC